MKRREKLLFALIEPHVGVMGNRTTVLFKCWRNYSPVGIPGKIDDTINIAVFPLIVNDMVIAGGTNCFDLDPEVIGSV